MQRVALEMPDKFHFATDLLVHITYVNHAMHAGNDGVVAMLNEARIHYLNATIGDPFLCDGYSWINADMAVIFKSEIRYGDTITVEVATTGFDRYGCDYVYRLTNKGSGQVAAMAKMAMLLYDYKNNCLVEVPVDFAQRFEL